MLRRLRARALLLGLASLCCAGTPERSLRVTATAYNSLASQTNAQPSIAAWGDRLEPGMKAIAVSRDLLELGLTRGTRVRIEGLSGEYRVLDKMARRWRRKIDVYMGEDVSAARRFGRRRVRIWWSDPRAARRRSRLGGGTGSTVQSRPPPGPHPRPAESR